MKRKRNFLETPKRIRRRRQRRSIKIVASVLIFLFTTLGLFFIVNNERLLISSIEITNNDVVKTEHLRDIVEEEISGKYFFLFARKNALFLPRKSIEKKILNKHKRVESIHINLVGLNTLNLNITERVPYALWCGEKQSKEIENFTVTDSCFFIDRTGFVFDKAPGFSRYVYFTIYSPLDKAIKNNTNCPKGSFISSEVPFKYLVKFREILASRKLKTTHLVILPNKDYKLILVSGGELIFSGKQNPNTVLDDLLFAIDRKKVESPDMFKNLKYIDARFISTQRVFFKFH